MHSRGIVHRDLKPADVLLQSGVPRIADFGLAVLRNDEALGDIAAAETLASPDSPPLTRVGAIMGTPLYMAPELVAGAREARPAADVFAFGVMAYQMLSGGAPFAEPPLIAKLAGKPTVPAPSSADTHFIVTNVVSRLYLVRV
jgi:serine/threonine-protein kinase